MCVCIDEPLLVLVNIHSRVSKQFSCNLMVYSTKNAHHDAQRCRWMMIYRWCRIVRMAHCDAVSSTITVWSRWDRLTVLVFSTLSNCRNRSPTTGHRSDADHLLDRIELGPFTRPLDNGVRRNVLIEFSQRALCYWNKLSIIEHGHHSSPGGGA